jgi:hypothetical protein
MVTARTQTASIADSIASASDRIASHSTGEGIAQASNSIARASQYQHQYGTHQHARTYTSTLTIARASHASHAHRIALQRTHVHASHRTHRIAI